MAQRSPWDYGTWSSETKMIAGAAAVAAFVLFLLLGAGWLIAVIVAVLAFLGVVWWRQREAAEPAPPYVSTPVAPAPLAPAPPVEPSPAAVPVEPVAVAAADPMAVASSAPLGASRPAGLDGPREGGPDDLKKIKGVGPKLEAQLNSLGYYHFDQVAAWSVAEVAWVDGNLEGFRGRASRDDWVGQAAILAAGGETEFSQRVDRGDV